MIYFSFRHFRLCKSLIYVTKVYKNRLNQQRHKFGKILKPIIPVKIEGPERSININMIIDSGADISLLPYSLGELLGLSLEIKTLSELQGIGEGSVPYILGNVELQINNFVLNTRIGWALIEDIPFILGRLDVFNEIFIEFKEFENRIIIKHKSEF